MRDHGRDTKYPGSEWSNLSYSEDHPILVTVIPLELSSFYRDVNIHKVRFESSSHNLQQIYDRNLMYTNIPITFRKTVLLILEPSKCLGGPSLFYALISKDT